MPIGKCSNRLIYLLTGLLLFVTEVLIALYVHDSIIRPHIGDLLVVIMIYCFVRAILNTGIVTAAVATLAFAYLIEILQYFKIVKLLGLDHLLWARVIIGTHFSWIDMLAYTAGIALVLVLEKIVTRRKILITSNTN